VLIVDDVCAGDMDCSVGGQMLDGAVACQGKGRVAVFVATLPVARLA